MQSSSAATQAAWRWEATARAEISRRSWPILARDAAHPKLVFQLLIYPCVAPEPETPSHHKFKEGYVLSRNSITWFYKQYLRSGKDVNDFRFAPLLLDDLSGLPPALVIVAGYDPLRDEGIEYARKLIEAGNRVKLSNYEGMVHGFYLMAAWWTQRSARWRNRPTHCAKRSMTRAASNASYSKQPDQ